MPKIRKKNKPSLYEIIDPDADNQYSQETQRGAVKIEIPCLNNGYDWYALLTVDRNSYDRSTATKVSKDHLPFQGIVTSEYVTKRLRFLKKPNTPGNYENTQRELELNRQLITRNISSWIKQFIIYVANESGMKNGDNVIMTWDDYMFWIETSMKTHDDALLVFKTLYISFHYVEDFKLHLTICIMITFNLSMSNASSTGVSRNFVTKMITFRINQLRKQVNKASLMHNGYSLRIIRPRTELGLDNALPKYFMPWMITKQEPLKNQEDNKKRKRGSIDYNRRRNVSTYSKTKFSTEEEVLLELENIESSRNVLLTKLEELRKKKHRTEKDDGT